MAPQGPQIPHPMPERPSSLAPDSLISLATPGHHWDLYTLLGELAVGLLPLANSYTPFKVQMLPPLGSLPFSSPPWKISGISSPSLLTGRPAARLNINWTSPTLSL